MDVSSDASKALELFHHGEFAKAIDLALHLISINQYSAEMYHLVGAAYHSQGKHHDALPYLRKAIIQNPTEPAYFNTYGVVLRKAKDYLCLHVLIQ